MDEQEQQEQAQQAQQEQAAFEQAFASVSGIELLPPTADSQEPVAGVEAPAASQQEAAAPESSEETPQEQTPAQAHEGQAAPQEPQQEDDDPVLLDGLKRSELHRLFGKALEVDDLRRRLDKAHGSIGDLNRRLQHPPPAASATPAPAPAAAPELPADLKRIEEDYPDIAQYVRHHAAQNVQQPASLAPQPQQQSEAPPAAPAVQAGLDPLDIEMAVMDRLHNGWREKIGSQDFGLWLGAQNLQTQQAYGAAQTADAMAAVIGQYDQWATARTAAADKAAKGQQRLQKAVTPTGAAQRAQAAPTEMEAMEAAFKRTLGL